MNKESFYKLVENPEMMTDKEIFSLKEMIRKFPYFQTARILYLLELNREKSIHYYDELKTTSIYANDRAHLKQLIQEKITIKPTEEPVAPPIERDSDVFSLLKELQQKVDRLIEEKKEKEEDKELLQLAEQAQQIEELIEEKEQENKKEEVKTGFSIEELEELPEIKDKSDEKDELIEKFLKREESPKGESSFFDPVRIASKSLEENEDIISETLAHLYYEQGYDKKAIKIYQKLMLLYPKNSSYFAAFIKKIENKVN